ncbi:MAG: response regulator [Alphaproteobacteria bacterium]
MRILIADDHGLFREGMRLVLQQLSRDLVVIEAADFPQTLRLAASEPNVRVILLDLAMPGMPWTAALTALRATVPQVPVVILSASEDRGLVRQAIDLGASGFIPKSSTSKVMVEALQQVLRGEVFLPATREDSSLPVLAVSSAAAGLLTPRQREVLALVGEGRSNKEIARQLALSEGTVKLHVTAILKALNVNNRTRAVVTASQMGLTPPLPRDFDTDGVGSSVDFGT